VPGWPACTALLRAGSSSSQRQQAPPALPGPNTTRCAALARRFKGMQALLASNNPQHLGLAGAAGLRASSMLSGGRSGEPGHAPSALAGPDLGLPSPAAVAEQVLQELGGSAAQPCRAALPRCALLGGCRQPGSHRRDLWRAPRPPSAAGSRPVAAQWAGRGPPARTCFVCGRSRGGGGAASSQPAWLTSGAAGPQGPAERRCRRCHGLPVGAARLRNTAQLWTLLIIRSASIDRFAAPGAPSARCSKCQPQAAATPD
jgi:hypothetical protein